jgi:hypothetical protein
MKIYPAMAAILKGLPTIEKANRSTQGYAYQGIDQILTELKPVLEANEVFLTQEVLEYTRSEYETRSGAHMQSTIVKVAYNFHATDGSTVTAIGLGEGSDAGDKSVSKALAMALKYALRQSLCIASEEHDDTEAHDPGERAARHSGVAGRPGPSGQSTGRRPVKAAGTSPPPRVSSRAASRSQINLIAVKSMQRAREQMPEGAADSEVKDMAHVIRKEAREAAGAKDEVTMDHVDPILKFIAAWEIPVE